jgi:hypothetical protein
LNLASPQSELAPALLALVRTLLQDDVYAAPLKRHYRLFKQAVDKEARGPGQQPRRPGRKPKKRK